MTTSQSNETKGKFFDLLKMYGEQPTTDSEDIFEDIAAFVARFKDARAKHDDLEEKERKEREKRAMADKRSRDKEEAIALAASHSKNPSV